MSIISWLVMGNDEYVVGVLGTVEWWYITKWDWVSVSDSRQGPRAPSETRLLCRRNRAKQEAGDRG